MNRSVVAILAVSPMCLAACDKFVDFEGKVVLPDPYKCERFLLTLRHPPNGEPYVWTEVEARFETSFTVAPWGGDLLVEVECIDSASSCYWSDAITIEWRRDYTENPVRLGTVVLECEGMNDSGAQGQREKTRETFERLFGEWQEHMARPEVSIRSAPSAYTRCRPFAEIEELRKPALPLIIGKMEEGRASDWQEGQFFLWYAVRTISGVDLVEEDETLLDAQETADRYIDWWRSEHPDFQPVPEIGGSS